MNVIFFETEHRHNLLPLCFTRPVALLRAGILTVREKWERRLDAACSFRTEAYLSERFPTTVSDDNLLISAHVCPTDALAERVSALPPQHGIVWRGVPVAGRVDRQQALAPLSAAKIRWTEFVGDLDIIRYPWDLTETNGRQLDLDFQLITRNRQSASLNGTNRILGENIFVEEGVTANFAVINASDGPVYIGRGAELKEGALIHGPVAICDNATVNMGTRLRPYTTIGPWSKVGGEICQSVILGFTNKAHDGFLGHSVVGEWCNLGAGTNVSDLKNSYEKVRVWQYPDNKFVRTNLQFCGIIMGDFSRTGISSMFNTGTVIGTGCNIYGAGFPRQFIPSFAEGGAHGYTVNTLKALFKTLAVAMNRRGRELTDDIQRMLTTLFDMTAKYRNFE
ncbi:MAG: glucose-1-phosphate thymidylyltransferase [Bacteroidales bacterium]|jgi:UDP-N-acetylglucosamine diphosphorylase/glucosamine-1-phosphate N-acetyltransferase|nr:glucose-1-phosphate thymidylyltransferase [Bacteroidales bacterium]